MANTRQFHSHERLFWTVLAMLARNGVVAPPGEARDIVHDFYVDAWQGLLDRYDDSRSAFETYASAAFYRFARRRIMNLQTWSRRLVQLETIPELPDSSRTPQELAERVELVALIRDALTKLPAKQRSMLYEFTASGDASERALAKKFSLSRYALKEQLIDALGRVALEAGRRPDEGTLESKVADSLWLEGRSVRSTAASLGVPVAEVHAAKHLFTNQLLDALRSFENPTATGRTTMLEILKAALINVDDPVLLKRVRDHAHDILDVLEEHDVILSADNKAMLDNHPEWVAEVYDALGCTDDGQRTEIGLALQELRQNEDCEIGEAFAALIGGLGGGLTNWGDRFREVVSTTEEVKRYTKMDTSVEAAQHYPAKLLECGLTPTMFHGATRALEGMLSGAPRSPEARDEFQHEHWNGAHAPRHDDIRVDFGEGMVAAPFGMAVAHVAGVQNLPERAAAPMTLWTLDVLRERSHLVQGYQFDVARRTFKPDSTKWGRADIDLIARWCAP